MAASQQFSKVLAAESFLGWWRDAGVDMAVEECVHDWLGVSAASVPTHSRPKAAAAAILPQSLEAFVDLLMIGDIPDGGSTAHRIRPSGRADSDLMILTDYPESADLDCGVLLSDPLFDKMLAAIGKSRALVYIASLSPGKPMTGRLSADCFQSLAVLAKQHLALIAPKQLWLVGAAASRAILGIDDAAARGRLHSLNHEGHIISVIATAHPRMFAGSPSRKAAAWSEMQRLLPEKTL